MGELYRDALIFFSSYFAFVTPGLSRCVPLLSLQAMVAVGTRPVALGVMLVVFSVSCIDYASVVVGYTCTVKTAIRRFVESRSENATAWPSERS
jgi:hypothetical protein